jgi:hypothetical protein
MPLKDMYELLGNLIALDMVAKGWARPSA